jgi:adenylyltransferase/sulfurtransferase
MTSITPESLLERILKGEDMQLIDVRTIEERKEFNIGGLHITLSEIFENTHLIDTGKPVVIYCQKGIRSQIAIQRLQLRYTFSNLINLSGGIDAWKKICPKEFTSK